MRLQESFGSLKVVGGAPGELLGSELAPLPDRKSDAVFVDGASAMLLLYLHR